MPADYTEWLATERGVGTVALRASGASGEVAWSVDGHVHRDSRLALIPGAHVIAAESRGERREVRITVDAPPGTR